MLRTRCGFVVLFFGCCGFHASGLLADDPANSLQTQASQQAAKPNDDAPDKTPQFQINCVVTKSFSECHDGWSSDEVILNDELNAEFLKLCQQQLPNVEAVEFNWTLLNLRKAGKLSEIETTRRRRDQHDEYVHAAEIAARYLFDKHQVSTDRVLCDPQLRSAFDKAAVAAAPGESAYNLRKAAFGLRKARLLRPELVVRVADWGKQVLTFPAESIVSEPTLVPKQPGIYIFRDATGYLYVGESFDLRDRVTKHLDHSDRKTLAHYLWQNGNDKITVELHAFDSDSNAKNKTVRRAYESELIASRKPRFNIAP